MLRKFAERGCRKGVQREKLKIESVKINLYLKITLNLVATNHQHIPEVSIYITNGQILVWWGSWRYGEMCRVSMGHMMKVTVGSLHSPQATVGHLRVTVVHLGVTIGSEERR